jgi:predicted GH43/DUF377 family glycosyl hydrolase
MKRSRLAIASLWPLGVALAVLLAAGAAEGQTPWTKYVDNPVLEAGDPGEWDQGGVASGAVLFDGAMYHMWYGGFRTIPPVWPDADIGYATSPDGVTWTEHPDPVLVRAGTWDSAGIFPGAVVWDGALYHMWYVGGTSASFTQTGYATSPDGVSWTPYGGNPVLKVGDPGGWDAGQAGIHAVIADGGTYLAWYIGSGAGLSGELGYATSTDGVTWTKYAGNPVLWPLGYGWDGYGMTNPAVVFDGTYHMWYTGYGSVVQIGHASSPDGVNWVRQPAYPPVLTPGPAGAWDRGGVDMAQMVLIGDTAHMWYTGWIGALQSVAIGHATAPLPLPMFFDGFETGDTSAWSATLP